METKREMEKETEWCRQKENIGDGVSKQERKWEKVAKDVTHLET